MAKRRRKYNKRKNSNISIVISILIAATIIAGIIYYGGSKGWFKNEFEFNYPQTEPKYIPPLDSPEPEFPICTISINQTTAYVGQGLIGRIDDGKNTECIIFFNLNDTWYDYDIVMTNANGQWGDVQDVYVSGIYIFRAICGYGTPQECITNSFTLTVLPWSEPEDDEVDLDYENARCDNFCTWDMYMYGYYSITGCRSWEYFFPRDKCCCGNDYCFDGDGGLKPYTFSYAEVNGNRLWDSCADFDTALEYTCLGYTAVKQAVNCNVGDECKNGYCQSSDGGVIPLDSDGDGYSDAEEQVAGTDPTNPYSYPNGLLEQCANACMDLGFHWATYGHSTSASACYTEGWNDCRTKFSMDLGSSNYIYTNCCCFECVPLQ